MCPADDTFILISRDSWEKNSKFGKEMQKMKIWLDCNLLSFNVEKTKHVMYSAN